MFWNQISEECCVFGMNSTKVSPWLHFTAGNGLFRTVFPKGLWPLLCLQRVIKAGASSSHRDNETDLSSFVSGQLGQLPQAC